MIYVYGNSHANIFTRQSPGFLGDFTHGSFKSHAKRPLSGRNFIHSDWVFLTQFMNGLNKEKDHVLITTGEHDCRVDLHSINEIHPYIDNFFQVILKLKNEGYRPIGWGSHPSINIPFSIEWDSYMKQKCEVADILFISILETVIKNNALNKTYYIDDIHLNNNIMPIVELKLQHNQCI